MNSIRVIVWTGQYVVKVPNREIFVTEFFFYTKRTHLGTVGR